MEPGALSTLRPGPWMMAAADDPSALPGEVTVERDGDHLLRVRRPGRRFWRMQTSLGRSCCACKVSTSSICIHAQLFLVVQGRLYVTPFLVSN